MNENEKVNVFTMKQPLNDLDTSPPKPLMMSDMSDLKKAPLMPPPVPEDAITRPEPEVVASRSPIRVNLSNRSMRSTPMPRRLPKPGPGFPPPPPSRSVKPSLPGPKPYSTPAMPRRPPPSPSSIAPQELPIEIPTLSVGPRTPPLSYSTSTTIRKDQKDYEDINYDDDTASVTSDMSETEKKSWKPSMPSFKRSFIKRPDWFSKKQEEGKYRVYDPEAGRTHEQTEQPGSNYVPDQSGVWRPRHELQEYTEDYMPEEQKLQPLAFKTPSTDGAMVLLGVAFTRTQLIVTVIIAFVVIACLVIIIVLFVEIGKKYAKYNSKFMKRLQTRV